MRKEGHQTGGGGRGGTGFLLSVFPEKNRLRCPQKPLADPPKPASRFPGKQRTAWAMGGKAQGPDGKSTRVKKSARSARIAHSGGRNDCQQIAYNILRGVMGRRKNKGGGRTERSKARAAILLPLQGACVRGKGCRPTVSQGAFLGKGVANFPFT